MEKKGITFWAGVAFRETLRAANAKDYTLRRKSDREMKRIANELVMGRGYVIATDKELASRYPGMFTAEGMESKKMIWAVGYTRNCKGNKMAFVPVR